MSLQIQLSQVRVLFVASLILRAFLCFRAKCFTEIKFCMHDIVWPILSFHQTSTVDGARVVSDLQMKEGRPGDDFNDDKICDYK